MYNKYVTAQDWRDMMNMAKARVHHYISIGWTMFTRDELLSAAYEGICEAMIRFEPSKGIMKDTKPTSYCYFWIEKYLKEYITHNKTMLNGTPGELWSGQVPYTSSIDALDTSDNDNAGSDHKDWLGTNILPSTAMEAIERQEYVQSLLSKIFLDLEPRERLIMQLSVGIGTVHGVQLSVREIAKALHMTCIQVQQSMDHAFMIMRENKEKYEEVFAEL